MYINNKEIHLILKVYSGIIKNSDNNYYIYSYIIIVK